MKLFRVMSAKEFHSFLAGGDVCSTGCFRSVPSPWRNGVCFFASEKDAKRYMSNKGDVLVSLTTELQLLEGYGRYYNLYSEEIFLKEYNAPSYNDDDFQLLAYEAI